MKWILAAAMLFALASIASAGDAPDGMMAVPSIPLGTPLVQGSCPNGQCRAERAVQALQGVPLRLSQSVQAFTAKPKGCRWMPFGGRFRVFR